ncbi:MAG: hypothetical protein NC045_01905, partial [Bacteroides sp.]|nr:hypothetical protein [Bacteroides sp.]
MVKRKYNNNNKSFNHMRKSRILFGLTAFAMGCLTSFGASVQIKMNSTSQTMTLAGEDGTPVEVGTPSDRVYNFDCSPGNYILTGFEADGTANGTIVVNVEDVTETQSFDVFTHSLYATNRDDDGNLWQYGTDYTAEVKVVSRDGGIMAVTIGDSSTDGRKSVMSFSGNSVYLTLVPSETRKAEGYLPCSKSSTVTFNMNLSAEITVGMDYSIILPIQADVQIGQKGAHFTEFSIIDPVGTTVNGDTKTVMYRLASKQKYDLRTWKKGGLTQALYFKPTDNGAMTFTESDYSSYNPKQVNHDPSSNKGYETGNIFININERNHLVMNVGDSFDVLSMRSWQLTDTQIDNYFFEPDFHYTILDIDGNPSSGVIEVPSDETTSPWRTIKAIGNGTAIVLITYDAIKVSRPQESQEWMGGEYWGAIWPENTAVFIVSVGETSNSMQPNMLVNENYNIDEEGKALKKLAGKYVDSEHDVFYYLDTEQGFNYTFIPEGVESVLLAYPTIGENSATYTGFGTEGVTANPDGSYTVLLKNGRNIVKLTDASGKSVYQVMTAKSCHREITNETRKGSDKFYTGDKVKIQYSGLFHPANKLAGIYNMSAYVTYNGVPNGTSLILGPGQYTFGSAASAQAVEFVIPEDYDAIANPVYTMDDGVIQVNGFGDPIGNHRNIDKVAGRSPNFTATAHKTYFGAIPEVNFNVYAKGSFSFTISANADLTMLKVSRDGNILTPDKDGVFHGYGGTYQIVAGAKGYKCLRTSFDITEDMPEQTTINIELTASPNAWDGVTLTEPSLKDNVYQITNGDEFAWYGASFDAYNGQTQNALLLNDIDLGDYEWTPIGITSDFAGTLDGGGHKIEGLYINSTDSNVGLFSYIVGGTVKNLSIYGNVTTTGSSAGAFAGRSWNSLCIINCENHADVTAKTHAGGLVGSISQSEDKIENCINFGTISGMNGAGLVGSEYSSSSMINLLNVGELMLINSYGLCIHGSGDYTNLYSVENKNAEWEPMDNVTEIVSTERLASGEIAWRLGEAFGQEIGVQTTPVINGMQV